MMFFIRGLEVEIKNPVKMFEPKTVKQAYNLVFLEDNTFAYRRLHVNNTTNTLTMTLLKLLKSKPMHHKHILEILFL
jgi:hypothetical protein